MIPTQLLRYGLALAVAFGLWSSPAAAQQLVEETNIPAPSTKDLLEQTSLRGDNVLLYTQIDAALSSGIISQENSTDPGTDTVVADDFRVPAGMTWTIEQVVLSGFYSGTGAQCTSVEVGFWSNGDNAPGSPLFVYDVAPANDASGVLTVNVPATTLEAGMYWLSAQCSGNLNVPPTGTARRWNWRAGRLQPGAEAVITNPGGGFNFPSTGWNTFSSVGLTFRSVGFAFFGDGMGEPTDPPAPDPILAEGFDSGIPESWTVFCGEFGCGTTTGTAGSGWRAPVTVVGRQVAQSRFSTTAAVPAGQVATDVLATPMIELGVNSRLEFEGANSFNNPNWASTYEVWAAPAEGTTSAPTSIAAYTVVQSWQWTTWPPTGAGFRRFVVDLSAWDGDAVYLAFVHKNRDGDNFNLDNVRVFSTMGGGEGPGQLVFSPPVETGLVVTTEAGTMATGEITMTNVGGEPVSFSFPQYDMGDGNGDRHPANPLAGTYIPRVDHAKGQEPDGGPSWTPTRNQGGPDDFGYSWIDSTEPGGPAFEAINIASTGTPVTLAQVPGCGITTTQDEGRGVVTLPFAFSYYGETYNQVWVNANGHLNFLDYTGCTFSAAVIEIPAPAQPNATVAPLWADLHGYAAGQILTEQLSDGRFVIQYNNWRRFAAEATSNLTFQVILYPSGAIKFQYLALTGSFTAGGTRIGIENQDGTDGLLIASGPTPSGPLTFPTAGMAILISAAPPFIADVTPSSGTIAPGESVTVTVMFDAEDLLAGTYEGTLTIETDEKEDNGDAREGSGMSYDYPITLIVTGEGALTVDPGSLAFGSMIVGGPVPTLTVTVTNEGTDSATITGVSVDNEAFSVPGLGSDVTLAPGESTTFTVSFAPGTPGAYTGTLTIVSDKPNSPTTVALSGTGLARPQPALSTNELTFEMGPDQTASASVMLMNEAAPGAAPLEFSATVVAARPYASGETVAFDAPVGYDRASGLLPNGTADAEVLPTDVVRVALDELTEGFADITTLPASGWALLNRSQPLGTTGWFQGNATVFPSFSGAPTAYIGANFANTTGATGVISNWLLTPEVTLRNGTELRFYTRTAANSQWSDRLQVRLSTAGTSTNVGTTATSVGDFTTLLLDINPTYVPANYPSEWTEYTVTVEGLSGPTTGRFAFRYHVENAGPDGTNSNFIGIDEVSVMQGALNVSVMPESGTVAPGESQELTVTVNTEGLTAGVYEYEVIVSTNDPETPTLVLDVTVTVGVSADGAVTPVAFSLGQNYPNPFAGRTRVAFDLPEATSVTLAVYDVAGRRVATLVDAELPAGQHTAEWDANGTAAGVYFYRIQAGSYSKTLRALVIR